MASLLIAVNTHGGATFNDVDIAQHGLEDSVASFFAPFVEGNFFSAERTCVQDLLTRIVERAALAELGLAADEIESFTLHIGE